MSKFALVLAASLVAISLNGFAKKDAKNAVKTRVPAGTKSVMISCGVPQGFAGASADVSGGLKLKKMPNGAYQGTGTLDIKLYGGKGTVWSGKVPTSGTYDDLTSLGSDMTFHGAASIGGGDNDLLNIFADFTRPDLSYVEYGDKMYKMSCQ